MGLFFTFHSRNWAVVHGTVGAKWSLPLYAKTTGKAFWLMCLKSDSFSLMMLWDSMRVKLSIAVEGRRPVDTKASGIPCNEQ